MTGKRNITHCQKPSPTNGIPYGKPLNRNKTFLQLIPVAIFNGHNLIKANVILGIGSYTTLTRKYNTDKLELKGKEKYLQAGNALLEATKVRSHVIDLNISSAIHLKSVHIKKKNGSYQH